MIRLHLSREPHRLDLGHGVTVTVLPATTALMMAARRQAAAAPTSTDDERITALVKAIGRLVISKWEGDSASAATVDAATMHTGGTVGAGGAPTQTPLALFAGASRMHDGGPVLRSDEVPAILQTGERVLSRREAAEDRRAAAPVTVNIYTQDARSFMASRTQIAAELSRMVEAGRRGR